MQHQGVLHFNMRSSGNQFFSLKLDWHFVTEGGNYRETQYSAHDCV